MIMHKRKHRKPVRDDDCQWEQPAHTTGISHVQSTFSAGNPDSTAPDSCLYIQAYEADVIRGPPAVSARSLECQDPSLLMTDKSRPGLIRWGPPEHSNDADTVDTDKSRQPLLWVDRLHVFFNGTPKVGVNVSAHGIQFIPPRKEYDVRLLLDHLPDFKSETILQARPLSPSGWSDLPSDSEDTFFFSPDELEDYRREKRRKLIDRGREERLKVLAAMDNQEEDPDPWGGSDEEPDETQRELIRRTATHIISSPNPPQLEMRILANYGTDKRFSFLRGRWSRAWRTEKERAKQHQAEEAKKIQPPNTPTTLGVLAGYGDSDSDGGESVDKLTDEPENVTDAPSIQGCNSGEDVVKEARRARAREWSARRRTEQSLQSEQT